MTRRDPSTEDRTPRHPSFATRLETGLWLVAFPALLAAVWMAGDALWYQRRAERELDASWHDARQRVSAPDTVPATVAAGTPLARLSIPGIDLTAVVAEGVGDDVLRRAVGHVPSSARPGSDGNVAVAAHRDTFFRALGDLHVGDRIRLDSARGSDLYRVEWVAVVDPSETLLTGDTGYPALTLLTCYPFRYVGSAPYRYVVRARRVDESPRDGASAG